MQVQASSLLTTRNYEHLLKQYRRDVQNTACAQMLSVFPVHFQICYETMTGSFFSVLPNYALCVSPIHALRMVPTALARDLMTVDAQDRRAGFITIDQARQLYPISAQDPQKDVLPLLGM